MKKALLTLSLFILVSLACDMSVSVNTPTNPAPVPTNTLMPVTEVPTQIPASPTDIPATAVPSTTIAPTQPASLGEEISAPPLTFALAPEVAGGAHAVQIPRAEGEIPWWEKTPGHVQVELEAYRLQGKSHEPKIYIYPALEYAQLVPAAFEGMHRLNNIFYDPAVAMHNDQLPPVPFLNAAPAFASNVQLVSFQNGRGIRFLTEYAQYPASANNQDLFYHFQGLSADGDYYLVAILPISAPVLAETSDAGAALPSGGVPYPYFADPNADMEAYYASVIDVLNATPPGMFTPTISQLDSLIQSMRINF